MKLTAALFVIALATAALTTGAAALQRQTLGTKHPMPMTKPPASTKYHAFMEVTGQRQGKFRGGGRSKSNRIPVISASSFTGSSVDKHTGQASGKRQHSEFRVTIEAVDVKEFQQALQTHETLTEVKIEMVKPVGGGKVQGTKIIKLTNAVISNVKVTMGTGQKRGMQEHEEVSFTYQKIQFEAPSGKKTAVDDWQN
ncbi:MAG: type VI secretion system tube protein Hcp [Fimbriimonadales bacterium]